MNEQRIFVGRKAELERFRQVLKDPRGQAILVVGQAGMGKSWLLDRMAQLAQNHPDLKCGYVRYEVTRTDSTDSTMALMIDHAFEAAQAEAGSFDKTDQRKRQWHALFKVVVPKGSDLLELAQSLRRDPQKHTRDQFLERLELISRRMPENGRAVFTIDPEKYMEADSADAWRLVIRALPDKIKFLFAQRPEDELIKNTDFLALPKIIRIPDKSLGILAETEVDDLVRLRADSTSQNGNTLIEVTSRYKGHPYAIQAALDIIERTGSVEALPPDPTPEKIAQTQWEQVCKDDDAIRLFEAFAILEVGVPEDIVLDVSGLDRTTCKRLYADPYLRGLLREEGQGLRIYHAILRDHIVGQMHKDEWTQYHTKAAAFYRTKLKHAEDQKIAPDALAATRLPEHVLATDGPKGFVDAFVNECTSALMNLGLLDAFISLSQRGLKAVEGDSVEEASLLGNLGLIYRKRGDLDQAEKMHKRSLEIDKKLGRLEGMAIQYGNLGVVYEQRGDVAKAREYWTEALGLFQQIGMPPEVVMVQGLIDGLAAE